MSRLHATIFISAILLFSIQPMIAKVILPSWGGTAAVWTACMMFFQTFLVLGYGYSHFLRRCLTPKVAFFVHAGVLGTASIVLLVTPVTPVPIEGPNLTLSIVATLAIAIGLPYFSLATTSSLVQAWHHTIHSARLWQTSPRLGQSTYRLYALSNFGSLLALASYPFLIEPWVPLRWQMPGWTWAFIGFSAICLWAGSATIRIEQWANPDSGREDQEINSAGHRDQRGRYGSLSLMVLIVLWFLLAFCPSVLLLATTNLMCQEIASVPFLWILPLSLYLVSFMICFDRPGIYRRRYFAPLLLLSVIAGIGIVQAHIYVSIVIQVAGLASVCFFMAMVCHGELERLKPAPGQLTLFFLIVAIGGAGGGVFVAIVAPHLFDSFLEFQVALLLGIGLMVACMWIHATRAAAMSRYGFSAAALLVAAVVLASLMYQVSPEFRPDEIFRDRNEYGLVRVSESDGYRNFISGNVDHGGQLVSASKSFTPTGYYGPSSGIGVAMRRIGELKTAFSRADRPPAKVAVVGMGIGAMLAWGQPQDQFVFYELNPLVESIAREHFSYLDLFRGQSVVNIGDGRVLLERQFRESGSGQFDLIAMDAFSSDAIPQHLLTIECFQLYLKHLSDDGILVAHVTNRFVDLTPVVYTAAQELGLTTWYRDDTGCDGKRQTTWILLCRQPEFKNIPWMRELECQPQNTAHVRWTDDFASLSSVTRWSTKIDVAELQASRSAVAKEKALPK